MPSILGSRIIRHLGDLLCFPTPSPNHRTLGSCLFVCLFLVINLWRHRRQSWKVFQGNKEVWDEKYQHQRRELLHLNILIHGTDAKIPRLFLVQPLRSFPAWIPFDQGATRLSLTYVSLFDISFLLKPGLSSLMTGPWLLFQDIILKYINSSFSWGAARGHPGILFLRPSDVVSWDRRRNFKCKFIQMKMNIFFLKRLHFRGIHRGRESSLRVTECTWVSVCTHDTRAILMTSEALWFLILVYLNGTELTGGERKYVEYSLCRPLS